MARPTPRPPARPDPKAELAKQGRLWGLSLCCATAGALTVYFTDSLVTGIGVFLLVLAVLGVPLYFYEKRHRK